MFYTGQKVKTSYQVSKRDYEKLKANGIKPGTTGEIVDIVYRVKFGDKIVELEDSTLDYANEESSPSDDSTLDQLKNMFGMK